MSTELVNALRMVADERSIALDDLVLTIEQAVTFAAEKMLERENLESRLDRETGEFSLFEKLIVCETVEDGLAQVSLEEALDTDPKAELGSEIKRPVTMVELGRIAAQSVRQMIHKKGRELELDRLRAVYSSKIGQVISGRMARRSSAGIVFDIGETEALLPENEQLALDRFERGRHAKLLIMEVNTNRRDPFVVVSRRSPELLIKLMEIEAPEVGDGSVKIMAISRDHEGRSKIAVSSARRDVDAVGACVGVRGGRIQAVVKEFSGEKIDVFGWTKDSMKLIEAAFTPAKHVHVIAQKEDKKAYVIVPEDQLSLAIGRKGINVRLVSTLTGWELDVMREDEYKENLKKLSHQDENAGRTRRYKEKDKPVDDKDPKEN